MSKSATFSCPTCGEVRSQSHRVPAERLRPTIVERLRQAYPDWNGTATCKEDLHRARIQELREATEMPREVFGKLDPVVVEKMAKRELISKNVDGTPTAFGDKMADGIASFGGSWLFLGLFALCILAWMAGNAFMLSKPADPYPFILLNLLLSCLAAAQAPIIMMSQNRQATKDRQRAQHDFEVNLKAELELRLLHEKLDHLLHVEWQQLLDIQATQSEMLEELSPSSRRSRNPSAVD